MTSTVCPARTPAASSARRAVSPETGMAAAWVNVRFDGLWASLISRATAYSAKAPRAMPNTSSPTRKRVTSGPIATTVPATS